MGLQTRVPAGEDAGPKTGGTMRGWALKQSLIFSWNTEENFDPFAI
jgi:hypothetical protein